ncbi:hypothetical protein, partial [Halothiobacillus sp.]|uniref:hypothetical protein n=1 Tax=Halothiobacillus sp. TaxID=1891311 RepID=UPI0034558233
IRIRELLIQGRKTRQSGQKPFAFYGLDNQAIVLTPHDGLLRAIDPSMDAFVCPIGLRVSTYSWNIISPKVDGLLQQVHLASFRRSPLNPQYLTKKQSVFQKIAAFVEKYKGVGGVI